MDSISVGIIRKKIYHHYSTKKEVPTLTELIDLLHANNLNYEHNYLKNLLHEIGYRYVRCQSPSRRHILIEKPILVCKRLAYINRIQECRTEKRNIYFMHETFMEARDVTRKGHRCLRTEVLAKINKQERLVILHACGPNGLLSGSFTTIKSHSPTGDHFGEVNLPKFEKWVNENLREKLQPNSVIAISSSPHNSIQNDKIPFDMWTTKADMQEWLGRRNIAFTEDLEKIFLLELIRKTRTEPVYVIDEILKSLGHTVLRVPPLHPELNPLNHLWADIKKKIAESHQDAPLEEKRKIWAEMYSTEKWQHWVDLVTKIETEYYDQIQKFDDIIDDIIERYEKDLDSDSDDWESDKSEDSEPESE